MKRDSGAVDQRGQAGGEDDAALLPSVPLEPSAAGAEPAGLQPGEFVAASGFAERDGELVAHEPAATAGEDRRTAGQTCALLLAIAGGRTSKPAAVRGDARSDLATAGTDGIDRWWSSLHRKSVLPEGWRGGVLQKQGARWSDSGRAGADGRTQGALR